MLALDKILHRSVSLFESIWTELFKPHRVAHDFEIYSMFLKNIFLQFHPKLDLNSWALAGGFSLSFRDEAGLRRNNTVAQQ